MELVFKPEPWTSQAICLPSRADDWFPEPGARDTAKEVKQRCAACPVIAACLECAMEHNELYGIWGGLSVTERKRLRRQARNAA